MSQNPVESQNDKKSDSQVKKLVLSARDGDDDAFAVLFRGYAPLVDGLVEKYAKSGKSDADLRSVAIDAFASAIQSFDAKRDGITFGLYAKICMENRLTGLLRSKKNDANTVSLDEINPDDLPAGDDSDPAYRLVEAESYAEVCRRIEALLSPFEYRVWMLFFMGDSADKIAERLHTDKKSVSNSLFRARQKLQKHFTQKN